MTPVGGVVEGCHQMVNALLSLVLFTSALLLTAYSGSGWHSPTGLIQKTYGIRLDKGGEKANRRGKKNAYDVSHGFLPNMNRCWIQSMRKRCERIKRQRRAVGLVGARRAPENASHAVRRHT